LPAGIRKKLAISPHDPSWKSKFTEESGRIQSALSQNVLAIHHIGSTAIPGILAKPTIDILVEVSRIAEVDDHAREMSTLKYESMGEYGIVCRRYFRSLHGNCHRAFHVHVFEADSATAFQHIAFRDYLLAHPEKAKAYSDLKTCLVKKELVSKSEYQDLKAPFVEACINDAIKWRHERQQVTATP